MASGTSTALRQAYDPIRDGIVTSAPDSGTWLLRDDTWTSIQPAAVGAGVSAQAITYDPLRKGLVAHDGTKLWFMANGASDWALVGEAPPTGIYSSLAFDAKTQHLMLDDGFDRIWSLVGDTWQQTLSPGADYDIVENPRRGSVEIFGPYGSTWEHLGSTWIEKPSEPVPVFGRVLYAAGSGELILVGEYGSSAVISRRQTHSTTPFESCGATDTDSDGLVGCDDPDCWWQCRPACPPYVSCP